LPVAEVEERADLSQLSNQELHTLRRALQATLVPKP
jgi:hypothetical protein